MDYEAECLAQPKGQLSSWPFRLCLGPYRHLAQFVSIPTASMAHVSIIVHADAAHSFVEFSLITRTNLHT